MCLKCCHYGIVWGITLFMACFLLISGILIRLYYSPYNLNQYMPTIHEFLYTEGVGGVEFDNLVLSFDGRLSLKGLGVLVLDPQKNMLATARELRIEFSTLSLVKGQGLAVRLLEFDGLGTRFIFNDKRLQQIGHFELPQNQKVSSGEAQNILTQVKKNNFLKYLEVVNFRNLMANITFQGQNESFSWEMLNTDIYFTNNKKIGTHGEITGLIKRDGDASSFSGALAKQLNDTDYRLNGRIGDFDSRMFMPIFPNKLKNKFSAQVKNMQIETILNKDLELIRSGFSSRLGHTDIYLPDFYEDKISLKSSNLGLTYFPLNKSLEESSSIKSGYVKIDDFLIEDHQGLILSGEGDVSISADDGALKANTTFNLVSAKIDDLTTYLPPNFTKGLSNWLKSSTNYKEAELKNIKISIMGDLTRFPFDYEEANNNVGLTEIRANFDNFDFDIHSKLPRVKGVSGEAILTGDVMRIISPKGGMMNDQAISEIDLIISDILNKEKPAFLRATGSVNGSAQGLLPLISQLFDSQPLLDEIEGMQSSKVDLVFPLDGQEDDLQFSVKTELTDTAFQLPHIQKPFYAEKMFVETTDQRLTVKSIGEVNFFQDERPTWPAKIEWQENMKNLGTETAIQASFTSTGNPAPDLLAILKTNVQGSIKHELTLQRSVESPDWFDVSLSSDLTPANIHVKSFDWEKTTGEKGSFNLEGRLHKSGSIYDADMLLLNAPEAEIMGAAYLKLDKDNENQDFAVNISPFRLGKTDASVIIKEGLFSLKGKRFNFKGIGRGRLHQDSKVPDGRYEFDLDELIIKDGEFYDVNGFVSRQHQTWQDAQINAKVGPDKEDFTLRLSDGIDDEDAADDSVKHLEFFSGDAGSALRALGIYENLHKGKMEAFLKIQKEHSPFGFDAKGHALIENAFVRKAPVMMRLLSLVSLEQIMSANQGIAFEEIKFPLEMQDRTLYIKKGYMKGANIGMKLAGSIDFKSSKLNLNGSLTPVSGLNSFVGNIPIVGLILTGTQGALMVADFGIKGALSSPEVWANPLSIVTPGILKDIFGGIFGRSTPSPKKVDIIEPTPTESNIDPKTTP